MTRPAPRLALTLCAVGVLAGCDPSLPPPPPGSTLTAETIATRETPERLQFKGVLAGKPIHLLVNNCKVYKVDAAEGENVSWTLVLEGEFYPLPTICVNQSLTEGKGFITASSGVRRSAQAGAARASPSTVRKTGSPGSRTDSGRVPSTAPPVSSVSYARMQAEAGSHFCRPPVTPPNSKTGFPMRLPGYCHPRRTTVGPNLAGEHLPSSGRAAHYPWGTDESRPGRGETGRRFRLENRCRARPTSAYCQAVEPVWCSLASNHNPSSCLTGGTFLPRPRFDQTSSREGFCRTSH